MTEHKAVTAASSKEDKDKALAIPDVLYDDSGRKFLLIQWSPTIERDQTAWADVRVRIQIPKQ